MVDVFDLGILGNNYGLCGKGWHEADFDGDGCVDIFDLSILANHYGHGTGGGTPVPEPGVLALLALGGLALIRRRR